MVLDSQVQTPRAAGPTCAHRLRGLPKPPFFFRPPCRRNIGVAHLAAARASLLQQQVSSLGDCVFGGFLQPPSNGFSNDRWALITALTPLGDAGSQISVLPLLNLLADLLSWIL